MTNVIFAVLYMMAAVYMAFMSAMFSVMGSIWLGAICLLIAGLFLVLMYKDGIMHYERSDAAAYSVWCGSSEVNDYYLTKEQAESLAFEYEIEGYENVTIRKEKGE